MSDEKKDEPTFPPEDYQQQLRDLLKNANISFVMDPSGTAQAPTAPEAVDEDEAAADTVARIREFNL